VKLPFPCGITGKVIKEQKAIISREGRSHPQYNPTVDNVVGSKSVKDIIISPMRCDGKCIGVLQLTNKQVSPIDDNDIVYN
jgi:hypothetical protein